MKKIYLSIFLFIIIIFALTSYCWADYSTDLICNTPPSNNDFSDYLQLIYDNFDVTNEILSVYGSKDSFFESLEYLTCTYVNYQGSYYLNIFMSENEPVVTNDALTFPPFSFYNGVIYGKFYMSGSDVKLYIGYGLAGAQYITNLTSALLLSQSEIYANYDSEQSVGNYNIVFTDNSDGVVYNNGVVIKNFGNGGSSDDLSDMSSVVSVISNALCVDDLFIIISYAIPLIVVFVLFVLGFLIVRFILRRLSYGS